MRNPFLIGLGLGLIAAVVFISATTGPLLARFALFFLTPLPIALAGLGWGWQVALLAGASGLALVTLLTSGVGGVAFAVSQVAPVALLTYLAQLSRPVSVPGAASETVEWYPVGRLVLWAAVMAGLLALGSLLVIGNDIEVLRTSLRGFIETTVKASLPQVPSSEPLTPAEIDKLTDVTLGILPAASAISWMGSQLFSLWLAARVALASGRLERPWPDLPSIEYPRGTALGFAAALLAASFGGVTALAASGVAGALFLAYVLLGLAVLHYMTRGQAWRPFFLWALYIALLVVNVWIGVVVAMIGLADAILQFRRRASPPPDPQS